MATTERHQDISGQLLSQADAELKKGDLLQASEKAWGAVAHYVKSVASDQGWQNRTHRDVNRNARELIMLTDDPKLQTRSGWERPMRCTRTSTRTGSTEAR